MGDFCATAGWLGFLAEAPAASGGVCGSRPASFAWCSRKLFQASRCLWFHFKAQRMPHWSRKVHLSRFPLARPAFFSLSCRPPFVSFSFISTTLLPSSRSHKRLATFPLLTASKRILATAWSSMSSRTHFGMSSRPTSPPGMEALRKWITKFWASSSPRKQSWKVAGAASLMSMPTRPLPAYFPSAAAFRQASQATLSGSRASLQRIKVVETTELTDERCEASFLVGATGVVASTAFPMAALAAFAAALCIFRPHLVALPPAGGGAASRGVGWPVAGPAREDVAGVGTDLESGNTGAAPPARNHDCVIGLPPPVTAGSGSDQSADCGEGGSVPRTGKAAVGPAEGGPHSGSAGSGSHSGWTGVGCRNRPSAASGWPWAAGQSEPVGAEPQLGAGAAVAQCGSTLLLQSGFLAAAPPSKRPGAPPWLALLGAGRPPLTWPVTGPGPGNCCWPEWGSPL
mmetsp:Transcript_43579/g.135338  ORF Transcript_43579/g.135338 Transcript_43579/m.135338 type:complete len:457 (-) Transcript_43579:449-1819(-)